LHDIVFVVFQPVVGTCTTFTCLVAVIQYNARTFYMRLGELDQVGAFNRGEYVIPNPYEWV
jgi:hypothetical protein